MSEDILSDVLDAVRLTGAVFYWIEATHPWIAVAPPGSEIAALTFPGADHVMEFHVMADGACWAGLLDEAAERAVAGDVVVFPHGDSHVLRSALDLALPPPVRPQAGAIPATLRFGGGGAPDARFACGFLACDARPFNPLLDALPRMLRVPSRQGGPLGDLVRLAVAETESPRSGSRALRARLAEMMFVEAVRGYLAALPEGAGGWFAGLRDPHVGRALGLLHARAAHTWSLDELAREVGVSRTLLHERFTMLIGHPPMQYLARWRMQLAASLLARGTDKIVSIALEVGYESEASFNRAFKRLVGVPPATWRRDRGARLHGSAAATAAVSQAV
ncbi:MAG: AraC family transcriptional regulator [Acetobacteraceae bacterium]